jgi:hypothetical protein
VKAAQRQGVKFGRKPKLSADQIDHARKLIEDGESRQYVADLLNVGRVTLYRQAGWKAMDKGDYATALKEFLPLAKQGYALVQASVGSMYHEGQRRRPKG